MQLNTQGTHKSEIIVYAKGLHKVGEAVTVFDNGKLVQTGKVIQDMSTVKKYQDVKKRVNGKDVLFNSGRGYYKVRLEEK